MDCLVASPGYGTAHFARALNVFMVLHLVARPLRVRGPAFSWGCGERGSRDGGRAGSLAVAVAGRAGRLDLAAPARLRRTLILSSGDDNLENRRRGWRALPVCSFMNFQPIGEAETIRHLPSLENEYRTSLPVRQGNCRCSRSGDKESHEGWSWLCRAAAHENADYPVVAAAAGVGVGAGDPVECCACLGMVKSESGAWTERRETVG